ncbi:MAG: aspartate aminotransferase family protein, partial [Actinobacteria bacterium]|nr:aspartate aminotransferase family protein [Actinomycetota bacterium]
MRQIDSDAVARLMERERRQFLQAHPQSAARFAQARRSLLGGVPMNWMVRWPGAFPLFVEAA